MSAKPQIPWRLAMTVAQELLGELLPACEVDRLAVVGSVRREKPLVGDVDVLFVSRRYAGPLTDLLAPPMQLSQTDRVIERLRAVGRIMQRLKVNGTAAWGDSQKAAVHVASGVAVDFFATTEDCWWNALVCKTGPMESNTRIATAAKERGWKWCPTREGFERRSGPDAGRMVRMGGEREVFEFAKLPWLEPQQRD